MPCASKKFAGADKRIQAAGLSFLFSPVSILLSDAVMTTLSADESALQAEFAKVDVRVSEVSVLAKGCYRPIFPRRCPPRLLTPPLGVELCATFGIDTKDLVTQWEALALSSSKKERKVELGDLETLSKQFAAKRPVKPDPRSSGSKNRKINLGGLLGTVTESPTSERLRRKEFAMDLDEPVQTYVRILSLSPLLT